MLDVRLLKSFDPFVPLGGWPVKKLENARRLWQREGVKARSTADGLDPKVLMAYSRWVAKHFDGLVKKHAGRYIAVYRNKLVAVGDSYKEVFDAAKRQGCKEPPLTMQVPGMEDIEAIL
jgi:hypothetical protein